MTSDTLRLLQPYLARTDLVDAFLEQPLGPYPDELLHMLTILRGSATEGKYALLEVDSDGSWVLCTLSGKRGVAPRINPEYCFNDLAEAERTVFLLRWTWWTGQELSP